MADESAKREVRFPYLLPSRVFFLWWNRACASAGLSDQLKEKIFLL